MMEIIKPEEILAELEKIAQKDLECVYVKTNALDIYLNDATTLKMDTNKGVTGIYFDTNVNMEKFKVDAIEKLVHATEAFDMFTEYYDEDDDFEDYDSLSKILLHNNGDYRVNDNDIRKILPLDKQNYREFHGICSKLQDNIILKPNEKKDKNQIIRKKTNSKLLEKLSSLKNKKVYENEEETKPLIEKENTQSEEEKKSVNSKNNKIPKQSIESIGMKTEDKILQNSTLNDIDELEEEKRIEEIKYRVLSRKPQLVYDSISDEEDSDEEVVETTYIEPSSNIRLSYDCILFILEIYSMFYIPFSLAFL